MLEIFPFFIILIATLVFSRAFRSFHIPWTIALIAGGMIIGPFGLGVITPDPTLDFLKYLGLVFLMFMAGFETRLSGFQKVWKESSLIGLMTGLIPLLFGLSIGVIFQYEMSTTILLGIIFISSSIAVVIPILESKGIFYSRLGKTIVSSIILQDLASLVLLAIFLQHLAPGILPFPIFITLFVLAFLIVIITRWIIHHLGWIFESEKTGKFEREIRIVFAVLIGSVLIFEFLGLHAIIGAFLSGLILSETIKNKTLKSKIYTMAYGLFIPIFFIMIGVDTNIGIFLGAHNTLILLLFIVLGSMSAKFISGWISSQLAGFTKKQSTLIGGSCIPQLSTTLAVIAIGQDYDILPEELVTTLIILSIITVFIGSLFIERLAKKEILE